MFKISLVLAFIEGDHSGIKTASPNVNISLFVLLFLHG